MQKFIWAYAIITFGNELQSFLDNGWRVVPNTFVADGKIYSVVVEKGAK